jgi:hypothetical protein
MKDLSPKKFEQLYKEVQNLIDQNIAHLSSMETDSVDEKSFKSVHSNFKSGGLLSQFLRGALFIECILKTNWDYEDHVVFKIQDYSKMNATTTVQQYIYEATKSNSDSIERMSESQTKEMNKLNSLLVDNKTASFICESLKVDIIFLPEINNYIEGLKALEQFIK